MSFTRSDAHSVNHLLLITHYLSNTTLSRSLSYSRSYFLSHSLSQLLSHQVSIYLISDNQSFFQSSTQFLGHSLSRLVSHTINPLCSFTASHSVNHSVCISVTHIVRCQSVSHSVFKCVTLYLLQSVSYSLTPSISQSRTYSSLSRSFNPLVFHKLNQSFQYLTQFKSVSHSLN